MAWPDSPSNIVLPGQSNLTGDEEALFKEKFIPNVMALYYSKCILNGIFRVEPLTGAYKYTEPAMGRTEVSVQIARGEWLQSALIENAEVTIGLDNPEYAKVAVARTDQMKTKVLIDSQYRDRMAKAMAKYTEGRRLCELVKAARADHPLTSEVGGSVLSGVDLSTATTLAGKGELLYDAIEEGVKTFRDKDIDDELFVVLTQSHIQYLRKYEKILNSDYGDNANTQSEGIQGKLAGVHVLVSNHANAFYGTSVTDIVGHEVDMTNTVAMMFAKDAILETSLYQNDWDFINDPDRLEYRIQVSAVQGAGVFNPACALEISSATAA